MRHPRDIRINTLQMTQQELAKAVSRSQASVSEWEERGVFPSAIIAAISDIGPQRFPESWSPDWLFVAPNNSEASK